MRQEAGRMKGTLRKWTVMVYLAGDNSLDAAGPAYLKHMIDGEK